MSFITSIKSFNISTHLAISLFFSLIGLFKLLCDEAGALKGGIYDTDYVRWLVAINAIEFKTEEEIKNICGSFQKKTNGTKRNGKNIPPIDKDHRKWKNNDKSFGDSVYKQLLEIKEK